MSWIWELPLGLMSYIWFNAMRVYVLLVGCTLQLIANPDAFSWWQVNSRACLATRLTLLRVMMVGPRWNTAAVCGSGGPFRIRESISFDLQSLREASGFWTLLVFHVPSMRQVAHASALTTASSTGRLELSLRPGYYFVNLRCYGSEVAEKIIFPRVFADGSEVLSEVIVNSAINEFHLDLAQRSSWLYRSLNFHAYAFTKWRQLLPREWVKRRLVPVGDPATRFIYGHIGANEQLHIHVEPGVLASSRVFYTLYNVSSFPVRWGEVETTDVQCDPGPRCGIYLLRVVRTAGSVATQGDDVQVEVQLAAASTAPVSP